MWGSTKNLDPIGSAVLTFTGYTDKQADGQAKYIKIDNFLQEIYSSPRKY